jgi:hypothetical protein
VAVDKAPKRHPAAEILFRDSLASGHRFERSYDPAGDRDVDEIVKPVHPGIAKDKIDFHGRPFKSGPGTFVTAYLAWWLLGFNLARVSAQ